MNLLLDTHIFLWLPQATSRLDQEIRTILNTQRNNLYLSIVSIWEIQVKIATGKLQLPLALRDFVHLNCGYNDIQVISVTESHIWTLGTLPLHHRDPFDRLLIAQAISEDLILVSADSAFHPYGVQLLGRSAQP